MNCNIILFDGFETLDVFGPAEVFGRLPGGFELGYYSIRGGEVVSSQGVRVLTEPFSTVPTGGLLLVPGGEGTRTLVSDGEFIASLTQLAQSHDYVLSVCTGSALLAAAGLLDGRSATSNKLAFAWVRSLGNETDWKAKARWVRDGKYYTSSGVSAGIDMALGFIRDLHGEAAAHEVAQNIEYVWNGNETDDPFAVSSV